MKISISDIKMPSYKRKGIVNIKEIPKEFYNQKEIIPNLKEVLFIRNLGEIGDNYNIFTGKEIETREEYQFFKFANNKIELKKVILNISNQQNLPLEIRVIIMNEEDNLEVSIKPYSDPFEAGSEID